MTSITTENAITLQSLHCVIKKELGRGSSGIVYLVEYQGGLAAVKIIARGHNIDGEQKYAVHFYEKGIKNPFYIRIRMTTQVNGQFILMMDYANLTSLNHLMDGRIPPLPESVVGIFIRQILICIAEFYEHTFIHRDLKLENIFLHFDGEDSVFAQVSDYGILIPESEAHSSKDVVGTPVYLAPEIVYLSPHYSHKSDTWAIGVMMFTLLCRTYPFQGTTTHQLYTSIQSNTHNITRRDLSQHCTDAINALLCKTPAQRPSAKQALEFPFFKQFEEAAKSGMPWNMFSQVTSGSFAKPPPQTFFIPDTHHSERNYRHLSPLRKALSPPSDFSLHPVSSPHNPNHSPSPLSADATRRAHPLPKNIPKHIQNGARFPARQFIGPSQVCEICGKVVPMDQMQQHKESEHNPPKSSPAALRLPQLVPKNTGPAPQEATRLKFVGLVNPGLQCYLNIVVQSLFHIPLFRNLLLSLPLSPSPTPTDPLHVGLHRLFQAMLTSQTPVNTSVFTQTIHFPQFDVRQMNDTQDFFNRLVNGLNSELKNTPLRGLASSLLSGRLIRKLTLEQRGRKSLSVHPEHFWSLRMPIELGNGVEEVLPKLLFPDQSGNTQKIYSIPPVLFVDLVRWTSGPRGLMKNNKRFAFPTSLDFSQLIEPLTLAEKMTAIQKKKEIKKAKGKTPSSTQFPQSPQLQQSLAFNEPRHATQKLVYSSELSGLGEPEKEQAWMTKQKTGPFYSQSFRYSLLAVEVHSGSLTMGHYYSFIRPLGTREWFECNDETIRRVDEREAIEGQFGGEMNGREVAHSAMSLVYVQDCHVDRIGMKEPTRVHPHPVPKPDPILNQSELISLRQQCDRLQSQLRQAEENNKALNDKLKSTEAEKRTVSEQLQLEHDKEKENMKKETIRQEINHKNEIGSLRQQCDDLQSRLIQAQMLNTTRQQTIDDLTRKGNDLQNRYRTMEDERNHLNQTVLTLNDKFKNADQVQKELEAQIRKLEQEKKVALDNLKKEKETSEQLKLKYTKEKENMNNKIIDLEKEAEARKKELEDRKQEMARQENDHKNALEKLTHERNQFESRLKNLEKDTDTIVKELKAEREKDMDRLRQELESQKSQTGASQRTAEQSQEERWKMVENLKKEEREREKLQQEFENYKTQHQLEKGTLNTTQEIITQLEKNNQDLRSENRTLKIELQKSEDARKAEEETNRKKDEELRHSQTELNNLKVQFEQTNDSARDFKAKWKDAERRAKELEDTNREKLRESEENNMKMKEEMTQKTNDFQSRYKIIEEERNNLKQTVTTLNEKLQTANQVQQQVQKLEKEKADMNQEMASQEANHKTTLENLTNEINQFESRLKNLAKDHDQLVTELETEKEKTKKLSLTLDQMEKDKTSREELNEEMNQLQQRFAAQKMQTEVIQQTVVQTEKELQTEKAKTTALQSEVDRQNTSIEELQQKAKKAEEGRQKTDEKLMQEERKRQEIRREFENYKTQHQLEKGTLNTTQERITQLVKNNQDLESEIETLKNELQKSQKSRKAEEEMNRKKDEELRHIQTELNNLKVQFEQTNDKASNFESKWKNLEKEKEHHTDTVLHLQNELCNALTDKQQSETRADTSEGVVRTLQEELNEKNQSISRLSMRIEDITVQLNETKEQVQRVQREATHQVTETQKFNSDMKLRAEEEKHQEESRLWQENKRGLETQIRRLDEGVSNDKALITTLEQKCLEFENKWKKANDEAVHLTAEVRKLKSLNQEHGPPISEKSVQQWQNCQNAKQDIKQLKEIFRNAGVAQAQVNRLHPKIDGSYFHSGPQLFNQMQILRQISTIVERLESLISKIISQSQPE